jgi:hypothetical protein
MHRTRRLGELEDKPPLMPGRTITFLLAFNIALGLLSIYIILNIWPETATITQTRTVNLFGLFDLTLNTELTYLLVVVFSAIIGAFVQAVSSIAVHYSLRDLTAPWKIWYATRPFVGAGLALALYFLVRGGLLNLGTEASTINIYGIAGLSGIVGMFTNQATMKLRDVAEALLKTEKPAEKPPEKPKTEQ